jgi:plasmid stability protein
MSVNLSVKNVPEGLAAALRRRARRNHRSLQGELIAILNDSIARDDAGAIARRGRTSITAREDATHTRWTPLGADTIAPRSESALMIRNMREGRTKTLADLFEELSALGGGTPSESAAIIRKSRSSR